MQWLRVKKLIKTTNHSIINTPVLTNSQNLRTYKSMQNEQTKLQESQSSQYLHNGYIHVVCLQFHGIRERDNDFENRVNDNNCENQYK